LSVFAAVSLSDGGLLRRAWLLVIESIQGLHYHPSIVAVGSLPQK
jgi:hypothetical protein